MKNEETDEILEELWNIKDEFSSSCDRDMRKIIEKMKGIAVEQGFLGEEINLREKTQAV